jgi:glucokinase
MRATIGVDVGATTISGGLVTPEGNILHSLEIPTREVGSGTVMGRLLEVIDDLVTSARARGISVDGIGIGIAGAVDPTRGTMLPFGGNALPELAHVPLGEEIRRVTALPVFVDNDANALALAEWMFGVGQGAHSLVLFAIGTHVGGGVIIADALVRGCLGYAGEFHAVPIDFQGPSEPTGLRGSLGQYVGGQAMAAEARQQVEAGAGAELLELAGGDAWRITSALVFQAAASGEPVARALVDRACDALAAGLGFIVNGLNPEVIVVTGGVARSLVALQEDLRRRAGAYALPPALASTRICVVPGDKRQTARGGAALVRYELDRGRRSKPSVRRKRMPRDLAADPSAAGG